jgi:hypothetical protein
MLGSRVPCLSNRLAIEHYIARNKRTEIGCRREKREKGTVY